MGGQQKKSNARGKSDKKQVAKVIHPVKDSSKKKVKADGYRLTDIQRRFFKNEGFDIYAFARSQGYGPKGAAFFLELAAQEVGYGNETSVNKADTRHNYFGDMQSDGVTLQTFKTKEEGIEYEMKNVTGLFHRLYPTAENILKMNDPSDTQLDEAIRIYNGDPNGVTYASWLKKNDAQGVSSRAIKKIGEEVADLQNQIDLYKLLDDENKKETQNPFIPDGLPPVNTDAINQLQIKIDDLKHIQQELQTGQADTTPFNIPDMPGWKNKIGNTTPANDSIPLGPLMAPPLFDNPLQDGYGKHSFDQNNIRYLVNPDDGTYQMPVGPIMNNTGSNPSPATHNVSPAHVNPPKQSQNGGGGAGVSFNVQGGLSLHTNNLHGSSTDSKNNIHDQVVAVLTSAIADAKIGIDIH